MNFFFFNDTATTEIYTLSLHDALPICERERLRVLADFQVAGTAPEPEFDAIARLTARLAGTQAAAITLDRKSTRLNSSHANISYAVFCLKKKNNLQIFSYLQHLMPVLS